MILAQQTVVRCWSLQRYWCQTLTQGYQCGRVAPLDRPKLLLHWDLDQNLDLRLLVHSRHPCHHDLNASAVEIKIFTGKWAKLIPFLGILPVLKCPQVDGLSTHDNCLQPCNLQTLQDVPQLFRSQGFHFGSKLSVQVWLLSRCHSCGCTVWLTISWPVSASIWSSFWQFLTLTIAKFSRDSFSISISSLLDWPYSARPWSWF